MLTKVLATLLYTFSVTQSDLGCNLNTVSNIGTSGSCSNSIVLDRNQMPIISYYYNEVEGSFSLKFARCYDSLCTSATFIIIDKDVPVTNAPLFLDNNDHPLISHGVYYKETNIELQLVKCHDETCNSSIFSTVNASNTGTRISMALNSNKIPVISYYEYVNQTKRYSIKIANCYNTICNSSTSSTVDYSIGNKIGFNSLYLDNKGYAVISYFDWVNYNLKLARCHDTNCKNVTLNTIDSVGNFNGDNALVLDNSSYPVICYIDGSHGELKISRCHDKTCKNNTLNIIDSSETNNIEGLSLALNNKNLPIISYYKSGRLKLARCTDAKCINVILSTIDDTSKDVGRCSSLTLSNNSRIFISYIDFSNALLKIAYCTDTTFPTQVTSNAPTTPTVTPTHSSIKVQLVVGLSIGGALLCLVMACFGYRKYCKWQVLLPLGSASSSRGIEHKVIQEHMAQPLLRLLKRGNMVEEKPKVQSKSKQLHDTQGKKNYQTMQPTSKRVGVVDSMEKKRKEEVNEIVEEPVRKQMNGGMRRKKNNVSDLDNGIVMITSRFEGEKLNTFRKKYLEPSHSDKSSPPRS